MEQKELEKRMDKALPTIKSKKEIEQTLEEKEEKASKERIEHSRSLNIYERLLLISTDLQTVAKNLEVSMGKAGKYKAVGEADVLRAVKPLELKHRVYSYPIEREIIESGTIESVDYNGNPKKQLFERIRVVYRFINIDKPEEFIDITSYGDGIDSGDKSVGKAMTYADKYALLKAYKMVTGDDPDQEGSQELKAAETKKTLDESLLQQAFELEIDLNKVATYYKKPLEELTDADLKKAIQQKKKALGGAK